ncbi:MAG: FTR1 family protein [Alphaproteobacteria bacterium]|nr:FTR1 family protein [Alphaproteobacteria bacterium]
MLASLLIVFREMLEAGLVVGIVMAATEGLAGRALAILGGIGAGVSGAALVAGFADMIAEAAEGVGQELFTAGVLLAAVAMLTFHTTWMSRHGRKLASEIKEFGRAAVKGDKSLFALAAVVGLAVMREGSEVVLFLYGIAASSHEGIGAMFAGGAIGLVLAAAVSYALYRGLLTIPMRHLFSVTNGMIALLAAGMAGQAAAVLAGADVIPSWGERLWNTSFILPDGSWLGRALHALIGYSAAPSGVQIAAWLATLAVIAALARWTPDENRKPKPAAPLTDTKVAARG